MHNNIQSRYYFFRYSNLLVSFLCIFLLILNKSEKKSSIFLDLSLRKIILLLIILLILFGIFTLREEILNKQKNKVLKSFWHVLNGISQDPVVRALWTIGLVMVFSISFIFLLYFFINPFSYYSQLVSKILGFILFIMYFSLTALLVEKDIYIVPSIIKALMLTTRGKISVSALINLLFVEFINLQFVNLVFKYVVTKTISIDKYDGNHFLFISFWTLIGLMGLIIYAYLCKLKATKGKITSAIYKNNLIYFLLFVILVILIVVFGHISYGVNDDYYMMTIASGQIDGIPDPHLVFTNIIIGELLKSLYATLSSVNWYSIYLISTLFISSFLLLRVLLFFFNNSPTKNIILLVFFIFVPRFFYSFTFTTVAILGSCTGMMLIIKTVIYPGGKHQWLDLSSGIFLVFFGGLIRLYAMLYTGLLMTPVFLYIIFKLKRKNLLILFFIPLFLVFVSYIIDNQSYITNPEWEMYRTYNNERSHIYSTPRIGNDKSQQQFFDSIGWHQAGLNLFVQAYFIDNQVFSLESLKTINSAYKYAVYSVSSMLKTYENLTRSNWSETCVFFAMVCLAFSFSRRGLNKKALIFIMSYLIGIILIISFILRMPEQLFLPSLFVITIYILAISKDALDPDLVILEGILPFNLYIPFLITILIFQSYFLINIDQTNLLNQKTRTYLIKEVDSLISSTINPLVVIQAGGVDEDSVAPFSNQGIPFDFVPTGWLINIPPYNHMLKKHGIENLINGVYEEPNVYLFGRAENDVIEYLSEVKHIKVEEVEHYEFHTSNSSQIDLVRLSETK